MKILHYLRSVKREDGGVVKAVLDHCGMLADASHQVILASVHPVDIPEGWRAQNKTFPEVVDLSRQLIWGLSFTRRGRRLMEDRIMEADIIYLHELWRPENIQLARIARKLKKPYLVPIYGMLDDWAMKKKGLKKRTYHILLGKAFLEGARFLQCVNDEEKFQAKSWAPKGKWAIMPYLVDMSECLGHARDESYFDLAVDRDYEFTFLFLSRFHPKKGLELLIDAASVLKRRGHYFKILLVGTGNDKYVGKLHDRVKQAGLEKIINFIGARFGSEKVTLYRTVDAFVLPTHSDNFGLVLIEAMACGLPVITTKKVGIWREIQTAGAMLIDVDVGQLAKAMEEIMEIPKSRRLSLASEAREWVGRNFDAARLLSIYEDMHREALEPQYDDQIINYSITFDGGRPNSIDHIS